MNVDWVLRSHSYSMHVSLKRKRLSFDSSVILSVVQGLMRQGPPLCRNVDGCEGTACVFEVEADKQFCHVIQRRNHGLKGMVKDLPQLLNPTEAIISIQSIHFTPSKHYGIWGFNTSYGTASYTALNHSFDSHPAI